MVNIESYVYFLQWISGITLIMLLHALVFLHISSICRDYFFWQNFQLLSAYCRIWLVFYRHNESHTHFLCFLLDSKVLMKKRHERAIGHTCHLNLELYLFRFLPFFLQEAIWRIRLPLFHNILYSPFSWWKFLGYQYQAVVPLSVFHLSKLVSYRRL